MAQPLTGTMNLPSDIPQQVAFGQMNDLPKQAFTLPPLPYAYNALEPQISAQIMTLHYDKHHQAYVSNLNAALANLTVAIVQADVPTQIALQSAIKFNGGGHINHSLFWRTLAPASSADAADPEGKAPTLIAAVKEAFGSLNGFTAAFSAVLMGIQGSGWGWLVRRTGAGGGLALVTTANQDPVSGGDVPIIGIDLWEHAYYLQYQNGKQSYIDAVWQIINWTAAEERFTGSRDEAFGLLKEYMA